MLAYRGSPYAAPPVDALKGAASRSPLRGLPVATVIANSAALQVAGSTLPTVDGKLLKQTFADAFSAGAFNKVPMIEGSNQHEYSLLSAVTIDPVLGHAITAADYPTQVNALFGAAFGAAVQAVYRLNGSQSPAQTFDNVLTDAVFTCNARKAARLITAQGVPLYAYEFADANAPMVFKIAPRAEGYGAYHAAEIQYLFPGNQTVYAGAPFTAAQTDLSSRMIGFWTTFGRPAIPTPPAAARSGPPTPSPTTPT